MCEMKKKDEENRMDVDHQKIKSADGGTGLLHKITKPTVWRGGGQILKREEEDAKP